MQLFRLVEKDSFRKHKLSIAVCLLFVFSLLSTFYFLPTSVVAQTTFLGPNTVPGVGAGFVGYDSSRNISIGTQYTNPYTKLFILASSTDYAGFAMRVEQPGSGPLFIIRNDGTVGVGLPILGGTTYGSKFQVNGNSSFAGNLAVSSGTISGALTGTLSSGNISSGFFGSNTGGGNYSFPGKLSVGTSTASTVADSLYVTGSVGVGTASPGAKLDVVGDAWVTNGQIKINDTTNTSRGITLYRNSVSLGGFNTNNTQVSFYANTGYDLQFTVNSSALTAMVVKNSTGKVGIGTTTPSSTLDVNGSINASTTGGLCIGYDCKTSWSQVAGIWTTTSTGAFYNGGNVGIGTASPGAKLEVSGNIFTSANNNYLLFGTSPTTNPYVSGGSNNYLYLGTSNNARVTVDTSGNVGIGTSTPSSKLHVLGNGYFDTASSRLAILPWTNANYIESGNSAWNGNVPLYITGYAGIQGSVATIDFATTNLTGNVGIGTASPSSTLHVVGGGTFTNPVIVGTPTANGHATTKSYVDSVITGGSSSGSFTNISVSGTSTLAVTSGNVGIGTAVPVNLLHAYGGSAGTDPSWLASTDRWVFENSGDAYMHIFTSNTNTAGYFFADTDARARAGMYYTHSNDKLYLRAGSTDSVTITASNVGIGNTSPSSTLHVSGTGQFTNTVLVGTPTASGHATTKSYVDSVVTSAASQWTSSSTAIYYNSGNVGIGTTSPGYLLDVKGNANVSSTLYVDTIQLTGGCCGTGINFNNENMTGLNTITISDSGGGEGFGWADASWSIENAPLDRSNTTGNLNLYGTTNNIAFWRPTLWVYSSSTYITATPDSTGSLNWTTTGSGNITFNPGGNVGVGTSTPAYKLDVAGTGRFTGTVSVGTPIANSDATTKSYVDSAVTSASTQWTTTSTGVFYNGGNVGIGTTSPGAMLDINGNMRLGAGSANSIFSLRDANSTNYYRAIEDTGSGLQISNTEAGGQVLSLVGNSGGTDYFNTTNVDIINFNSGQFYLRQSDGFVGIGNTSPSSTLHVTGGIRGTGASQFDNTVVVGTPTAASHATTKSYVDSAISSVTSTLTNAFLQNGNSFGGLATIGTNDAYPLALETSGSAKLTVATSGNVGIGTTSPGYKLDVNGKIYSSSEVQAGSAIMKAGTSKAVFGSNSTIVPVFINLDTSDARNDLVVATSGYVGVGIASPAGRLHIGSTSGGEPTYRGDVIIDRTGISSSEATGGLEFKADNWGSGYGWKITPIDPDTPAYGTNVTPLVFSHRNNNATWTDRFTLQGSTGYVGIGTIHPSSTLHVAGTGQFANTVVVGTPTTNSHAATKSYVDSSVGTIATSTFVKYADAIMNTNPFGGKQLFVNSINDAMFRAESRWVVTGNFYNASDDSLVGAISAANIAYLFDGSYETGLSIPAGQYAVINVNFSTESGGTYPGYPYGYFYLSHYYTQYSSSSTLSTVRTYSNYVPHGVGWHTYNFSTFYDNGSSALIKRARNDVYQISQAEFKIYAPSASAASITAIDWQLDRPGTNEMPLVDKYKTNYLYSGLGLKNGSAVTNIYFNPTGVSYLNGGNVSIGNTSPSSTLHVSGTGQFTGTVVVGTPTAASHATTKSYVDSAIANVTSSLTNAFTQNGNSFGGTATLGTNDAYPLGLEVGGTTRLTVATSGYVGIGTANPTEKLHIETTGFPQIKLTATGGGTGNWRLGVGTDNSFTFRDEKNTTDRLVILNSGNVGIGNTTPSSTLHVSGTGQFNSTVIVGTPTAASHAATKSYVDTVAAGGTIWSRSGANVYTTTSTDRVGIGTAGPETLLDVYGGTDTSATIQARYNRTAVGNIRTIFKAYHPVSGNSSAIIGADSGSTDVQFVTGGSTPTQAKMTILAGGNVGIGTTNPQGPLQVKSSNTTVYSTSTAQTSGKAGIIIRNSAADLGTSGYFSGIYFAQGYPSSSEPGNINAGIINIYTNPTSNASDLAFVSYSSNVPVENMRITNTGNVGIGTSTPAYRLDVAGTGRFVNAVSVGTPAGASDATTKSYVDSLIPLKAGNLAAEDNRIISPSEGVTSTVKFGFTSFANNNSAPYADFLHMRSYSDSSGGAENMFMLSKSGVHGKVWQQSFGSTTTYSSYRDIIFGNGSAGYLPKFSDYDYVNNSAMYQNGASIGIGNTSPSSTLHVSGGIRATAASQFDSTVVVGTPISASHAATKDYVDTVAAGGTIWTRSGAYVYTTTSTDNVGIGIATPGAKLEILSSTTTLMISDNGNNYNLGNVQSTLYFNNRWWSGQANPSADAYSDAAIKSFKDSPDGTGGSGLAFWSSATGGGGMTEWMRINKSGYVGIGTTNPNEAKLQIASAGASVPTLRMGAYATGSLSFINYQSGHTYNEIISGPNENLVLSTSGTGNVGIGTATPTAAKLTVAGTMQVDSGGGRMQVDSGGNVIIEL